MDCNKDRISVPKETLATFVRLDEALSDRLLVHSSIKYISSIKLIKFDAKVDMYDCHGVFWGDEDYWSSGGEKHFGTRLMNGRNEGKPGPLEQASCKTGTKWMDDC